MSTPSPVTDPPTIPPTPHPDPEAHELGAPGGRGPDAVLRPRALVTQLFADALAGDPAAEDHLRWLAVADDPAALEAFGVLIDAAADAAARRRDTSPGSKLEPMPRHRLDQLLAAVRDATTAAAAATGGAAVRVG